MRGKINFFGIKENNKSFKKYELLPFGNYNGIIVDTEDGVTKNGDPKIKVSIRISSDIYSDVIVDDQIIFPLEGSPAALIMGRTKHFLHCINQPYENEIEYDSDKWIGAPVFVEIFNDEFNKKLFNKISKYIMSDQKKVSKNDRYKTIDQDLDQLF